MSLTVTLTPTLIAAVVYTLGFLIAVTAFLSDEMSFSSPRYWASVASAMVWPLIIIQVTVLARFDMKDKFDQTKCDHNNISQLGDYEVNGRVGKEICNDCGKVWWEE